MRAIVRIGTTIKQAAQNINTTTHSIRTYNQTFNQSIYRTLKYRSMSTLSSSSGPMEAVIRQKLDDQFKPIHLDILNER